MPLVGGVASLVPPAYRGCWMLKSRNQLRLERRRAESEKPGTIQYVQAHRTPRPRRWMRREFTAEALGRINVALGLGRQVNVGGKA